MNWISVEDRLPDLRTNVLVLSKDGYYFNQYADQRILNMHVGFFYNANEYFKTLKVDIKFNVDCGCSGPEFERQEIEPLYWMPLPETPKE